MLFNITCMLRVTELHSNAVVAVIQGTTTFVLLL